MRKNHKLIWAIVILFVFLCTHVSSLSAENGSPVKSVENFAKAYFMLDNSMAEHLSKDALVNDKSVNMVDLYLEKKGMEAHNCGYKITFLQKIPTNMKIKILNMDDARGTVEFDAITIRSVNPVYRIIGSVIGVLEEYKVHDIITVIKEKGEWKIGPGAFEMPI
jgi:hypothetical protein